MPGRYKRLPAALAAPSLLLTIALAGCGAQPYVLDSRQAIDADLVPAEDSENLVGLAVSGGGSRAATFTASVLEELAKQIQVGGGGRQPSFLDRINYISSVSGGSLATAYYGLNKPARDVPVLQGASLSERYKEFFRKFRGDMEQNYERSFLGSLRAGSRPRAESPGTSVRRSAPYRLGTS